MKALTLTAAVLFCVPASHAAQPRAPRMEFDSRGGGTAALLKGLASEAGSADALPGRRVQEAPPIVATVPGIAPERLGVGVELGQLEALWRWLFPGQAPDSKLLAADVSAMGARSAAADFAFMGPDDYLADAARAAGDRNRLTFEVANIPWSRDPSNTVAEVESVKAMLTNLSRQAGGRPLYLVCHSWGSVLAHEALTRLAREGRPVRVRRFVTFGSTLQPSRVYTWLFKRYHQVTHGISWTVEKPEGVEVWLNFWAANDPYSGPIDVADLNVQVDTEVPPLIVRLKQAARAGASWNTVEKDLFSLTNAGRWHGSYFHGFKARLAALGLDVHWDTPQAVVGAITP